MNHMIDGDNGSHPFSPFYRGKEDETKEIDLCIDCESFEIAKDKRHCKHCLEAFRDFWDNWNEELYQEIVFVKKIKNHKTKSENENLHN